MSGSFPRDGIGFSYHFHLGQLHLRLIQPRQLADIIYERPIIGIDIEPRAGYDQFVGSALLQQPIAHEMQIGLILFGDICALPEPGAGLSRYACAPVSPDSDHVIYVRMIQLAQAEKFRLVCPQAVQPAIVKQRGALLRLRFEV